MGIGLVAGFITRISHIISAQYSKSGLTISLYRFTIRSSDCSCYLTIIELTMCPCVRVCVATDS